MARPRIDETEALAELPVAFTRHAALRAGLTRSILPRLERDGVISRFATGLYAKGDAGVFDMDLVEAALRSSQATICLTSALARHDLTDEIPDALHLALPRGRATPVGPAIAIWHQYDSGTFELDRTDVDVADGIQIGLYGPERSIVDAFNPRLGLPQEQAVAALRAWLRRRPQVSALLRLADHWPHAAAPLRRALQVLL